MKQAPSSDVLDTWREAVKEVDLPALRKIEKSHDIPRDVLMGKDTHGATCVQSLLGRWGEEKPIEETIEWLLEKGFAPHGPSTSAGSVWLGVARRRSPRIVQALLKNGFAVDAGLSSQDAYHILKTSCDNPYPETSRALVEAGIDINARFGNQGATILMKASQMGNNILVRHLLDKGVALETASSDGTTALMMAIDGGNEEGVRLLLEAGANPFHCDESGESCLDLAYQHPALVPLLQSYMQARGLEKSAPKAPRATVPGRRI